MNIKRFAIAIVTAALAACIVAAPGPAPRPGPAKSQGHGPPPHAPAHGYRAKTPQGVEIAFDTQIGVYVVVELPGNYWLDDRYYRKGASGWVVSGSFDGPWAVCPPGDLPAGLRSGASKPGKSKKGKSNKGN